MMNIRKWLIKVLGGIDNANHEAFRQKCEEFAIKNLTAKQGMILPNELASNNDYKELCVIKSRIIIVGGRFVSKVNIAPWCNNVGLMGLTNLKTE